MNQDIPETADTALFPGKTSLETLDAGDETSLEMSMNAVTTAGASAALTQARARFHRVLAGWASDVLRLERERRLGRHWPGARTHEHRAAA